MKALICVDVQNDFLPGGALGVPDGDQVVAPIVAAARDADLVVASRDWHGPTHKSFKDYGGIWPVHCVAETEGAALHPEIEKIAELIVNKGDEIEDAYSAFDGTQLAEQLYQIGAFDEIVVAGLATDYCVKATAIDALELGYDVTVLTEGCRAVNLNDGDGDEALAMMKRMGARLK